MIRQMFKNLTMKLTSMVTTPRLAAPKVHERMSAMAHTAHLLTPVVKRNTSIKLPRRVRTSPHGRMRLFKSMHSTPAL